MKDLFTTEFKKTIQEIRREYPNFGEWSDSYMFSFYREILEEQIIHEFITKTIDREKTINELRKRFKNKFSEAEEGNNGDITIIFKKGLGDLFPNQLKNIDEINKFMDSFGWFPSKINGYKYTPTPKTDAIIQYEPKYDIQVIPSPHYYHLIPDIIWDNVKLSGLTPKTKSKISIHPERVYLVREYNEKAFEKLAKALYNNIDGSTKEYIEKYYVLKINIEELVKSGRDKFYKDPNYSLGVWTYKNIPPIYIKKIAEIVVNPNPTKQIYTKTK